MAPLPSWQQAKNRLSARLAQRPGQGKRLAVRPLAQGFSGKESLIYEIPHAS
jgi:hypothetical protein